MRAGPGRGLRRAGRRAPRWLGPVACSLMARRAARLLLERLEGADGEGEGAPADGGLVTAAYLLAPPDPPAG